MYLERMIFELGQLTKLKCDKHGLINVKFTKKALEEIIKYLQELKNVREE